MKRINTSILSDNSILLFSQIVFLICGYGIQVFITRFLSPEEYGNWGVLTAVLVWFELTIISGFPKGVTKFIAESPEDNQDEIYGKTFIVQLVVGLFLGGLFYLIAEPLSDFWKSPELGLLFKISALDIPLYGLYFENLAVLNGKHRFGKMFWIQGVYSVIKVLLIVILVAKGYGLVGAAWGNVFASLVAFLFSQAVLGFPKILKEGHFSVKKLVAFCIPSTIFVIIFALVQRIDFLLLKSLSRVPQVLGYYWAAQLLARVPYFLVEGTSKKLYSELSDHFGSHNWSKANTVFRENVYLTFLLLGLIVSVTIGSAGDILSLLFPPDYKSGSLILVLLIVANSLSAFIYLFAQVLFAISRERIVTLVALITAMIMGVVSWNLIKWADAVGAACAAIISYTICLSILMILIQQFFSLHIPILATLRVLVSFVFTILLGVLFQVEGRLLIVLKLILVSSFYIFGLYIFREPTIHRAIGNIRSLLRSSSKTK